MNKLLATTAALAAFAAIGTANAADLPMKAPPMVAAAPVASWTGCWISGGVGYGMWNQDQNTETLPGLQGTSTTNTDGGRGWLGRAGVGCDYQFTPSFVIGVFGDYDWMNLKGTNAFQNNGLPLGAFGTPASGFEKESSAWAVGARLGYVVMPGLLTFVDGGYTQTRFDQINFFSTTLPVINANAFLPQTTYRGWFVGGGTEYALSWFPVRGLFWKTEYRFAEYRSQDIATAGIGATPGFGQHTQPFVQTVTSSLVWRFNWGGPVVAKY
jgi:outer membrane immunogenic protein